MSLTNENVEFFKSLQNKTKATYSAEDNKLRIFCDEWISKEDYQIIKSFGFVYAPKQEITGVATWTPSREDFCMLIAGEIEAEESTVIERAEAKAARLDALAEKRTMQTTIFMQAANAISDRVNYQPVLIGHHSESKALRDQKRIESNVNKAIQASAAVSYWNMKATGVELHANRKNDFGVRSRRIETLLADMRKQQSYINHGNMILELWTKINNLEDKELKKEMTLRYVGSRHDLGEYAPFDVYLKLSKDEIDTEEAIKICLDYAKNKATNKKTFRWISHLLNRLNFERSELGLVHSYEKSGLTAVIIQAFMRQQGAYKPSAKHDKSTDLWAVKSSVLLPFHIANDKEIFLTSDQVIELMMQTGYEVPAPKPKAKPILNFKAKSIKVKSYGGKIEELRQVELTKEEYKNTSFDNFTRFSSCGEFRIKTTTDPKSNEAYYMRDRVCVFISDSKIHAAPDSESISLNETIEEVK